jgi:hypothetical protein
VGCLLVAPDKRDACCRSGSTPHTARCITHQCTSTCTSSTINGKHPPRSHACSRTPSSFASATCAPYRPTTSQPTSSHTPLGRATYLPTYHPTTLIIPKGHLHYFHTPRPLSLDPRSSHCSPSDPGCGARPRPHQLPSVLGDVLDVLQPHLHVRGSLWLLRFRGGGGVGSSVKRWRRLVFLLVAWGVQCSFWREESVALKRGGRSMIGTTYYGTTYYGSTYYGRSMIGTTYYGTTYYGSTYYGRSMIDTTYYGTTYYGRSMIGTTSSSTTTSASASSWTSFSAHHSRAQREARSSRSGERSHGTKNSHENSHSGRAQHLHQLMCIVRSHSHSTRPSASPCHPEPLRRGIDLSCFGRLGFEHLPSLQCPVSTLAGKQYTCVSCVCGT